MGRFSSMKTIVLVFIIIPSLMRISHAKAENNYDNNISPSPSDHHQPPLAPSPFSSPNDIFKRHDCTDFVKEEMVKKVLEHLKAPETIKAILEKSAKFAICVANDFCRCFALRYEPVVIACLAGLGVKCMKEAIKGDHVYACTLACAKGMMNTTNLKLSIFFFKLYFL